jgi:transcription initiation factor TFIIH subunit 2
MASWGEDEVAYRWEKTESSWETVQEDSQGNIVSLTSLSSGLDRDRSYRAKRKKVTACIRRGLIRYLVVAVDASIAGAEKDMRPCRLEMMKGALHKFIREYFDQNPISQLSIIKTCDGRAELVTELSGNPKNHEAKLKSIGDLKGDASLQNLLLLAQQSLVHVPDYGTREILICYNSLKTRDPGDIFETIKALKNNKIRVSVICSAAELYICKRITVETHGNFDVSMDATHFSELLSQHSTPPAELQQQLQQGELTTEFVYMGFPKRVFDSYSTLAMDAGNVPKFATAAYVCPRCFTRTMEIPTQCSVCGLQLNSSTHIARSHHHLFPVPNFPEMLTNTQQTVKTEGQGDKSEPIRSQCEGCLIEFSADSLRTQCPNCHGLFCVDCDVFIHESLHNCPGCAN